MTNLLQGLRPLNTPLQALLRPWSVEAAIQQRIYVYTRLLGNVLQARVPTPLVSVRIPPNTPATHRQVA